MGVVEVMRAYRFALDLTPAQEEAMGRHAGAARWAYNHALAAKVAAHEQWKTAVAELVSVGWTRRRHVGRSASLSRPSL